MRSTVEHFLVDEGVSAGARNAAFEALGNSLGAMGFLIDMLSYQRVMAKKLFVWDDEAGEFKPVMGREKAASLPAVAAEPVQEEELAALAAAATAVTADLADAGQTSADSPLVAPM